MSFVKYNANPTKNRTVDCVIRAICKIEKRTWRDVYFDIAALAGIMYDMPDTNEVWGEYLQRIGYIRGFLPNTCPMCYTVRDFCRDHPDGEFILATGRHVIAVIDGDYYDTWDSGDEVPIYYFRKEIIQ